MRILGTLLIGWAALVLLATWLGYPLWLRVRARGLRVVQRAGPHAWWPSVTIVVVVRNCESTMRAILNNLLALAYPNDRRRILVVSDGSTDFTDAIVRTMEHRGVSLLRAMRPLGSARALNLARAHLRSEIVVVVDPVARLEPAALAALVGPFSDSTVGVTYGRESATAPLTRSTESPYSHFEAMLRERETRVFGTVSARRSLYAMRGPLFHAPVSPWLSPDFMLALLAREHGYRALHVRDAVGVIDRPAALRQRYARTVWAVGRDVLTLISKPALLDPRRYGAFSWMLLGHKMGRWATPWALLAGFAGLLLLAPSEGWARIATGICLGLGLGSALLALLPGDDALSRAASFPGRTAAAAVAIAHASVKALLAAPVSGPRARPAEG